jgi:phosphoglycerate dehydrogenase-like enzyme
MADINLSKQIYKPQTLEMLKSFADLKFNPYDRALTDEEAREFLADASGCMTAWGTRALNETALEKADNLKIVAHAAGTLRFTITDAVWDRNIMVTSASDAIAVDVAETTLGLMIISIKRIWQISKFMKEGGFYGPERGASREMNGKAIGIIGASNVGRRVMDLLKPFDVSILLYDPYCSKEKAKQYNAKLVDLDTLLKESDIISIHAPSNDETHHMFNARTLQLMKDDAILINTSRGTLIDESALITELSKGRLFACLDVFDPEPPEVDSPLRKLDNCLVTPHIAGCITNCTRMGDMAAEELRRYFAGEKQLHPVTREMMKVIA